MAIATEDQTDQSFFSAKYRKELRRKEAEERNRRWNSLSLEQQLKELDSRGMAAKKQRAKINKRITVRDLYRKFGTPRDHLMSRTIKFQIPVKKRKVVEELELLYPNAKITPSKDFVSVVIKDDGLVEHFTEAKIWN